MKYALITGASTGIGRATAIALAQDGFSLFLTARSAAGLAETKKLIEKIGGTAQIIPADLSDLSGINQLIQSVKQQTKSLNALVNIAGIWHDANAVFAGTDFAEFS
ncbi:MAG: hypothetical protein A3J60_02640 [Candidatus Pacebacteria bacterium RIFCSPHIGHO2_02_FULL_46_9]|nr:MAG: hypothetical protein A3J60_02640 [Candidatus Pacebacteria bacterium RIFCSPHIGHO2_02_FULL_46_9]